MSMCKYCRKSGGCILPEWYLRAVTKGDMYCDHFKSALPRISMNMTTPSFVTMNKVRTRRKWQPATVKRFVKGTKFLGVQRCYGGEALGVGEITDEPFKQNTKEMSEDEYQNEGFDYLDTMFGELSDGYMIPLFSALQDWRNKAEIMTVVPFRVIEVFPGQMAKYTTDEEIKRCVKALVKAIG